MNKNLMKSVLFGGAVLLAAPLAAQDTEAPPPSGEIPPATIDTDGDGVMDAWDQRGDGRADTWDTDGDGRPDAIDRDGDGQPDEPGAAPGAADPATGSPAAEASNPPTIDSNGDGTMDAWDTDGDGQADAWDIDGDGQPDSYDTDGDGAPDPT